MNSLSRSLIATTLLLCVLSGAQAQRHRRRHVYHRPQRSISRPAPKLQPVAVQPTPAPSPKPVVQATPAPVAQATPAPAASPAPPAAKTDIEARPLSAYSTPTTTRAMPASTIQDMVLKLVGVIGLMLLSAFTWRKLRRGTLPRSTGNRAKSKTRPEECLQITEQLPLNPQQMLYVVQYAERRLLVGASPQNLSLITDLSPQTAALPAMAAAALPARVSDAIRELTAETPSAPAPAAAPAARPEPEDRFAGIFDRLRAQEMGAANGRDEFRVPAARGEVRTIAELEEDEEEVALAAAGRRSLFSHSASNGGTRWAGR